MSDVPEGLRYSKDHEWARIEDTRARIGITDHAQSELTDVVYVELPEVGKTVSRGQEVGVVESVKAASEVYTPISGTITDVNRALADKPELVNDDPYGEGWIFEIELSSSEEADAMMDAAAYRSLIGQ